MEIVEGLLNKNVNEKLVNEVLYFKQYYKLDKSLNHRVSNIKNCFYGKYFIYTKIYIDFPK